MNMTDVLGLLGGLALFLYGMQMMSSGLEAAAGNRMKTILEKLTSNPFLGVVVGAVITAVVQSSSATTVMVVGFVSAGMMTLPQAVWIIMGANVGTTITSQLIALDVGAMAPLFAFVGVVMVVFFKKPQVRHYGGILAGMGVLFLGMNMMSNAMVPLRDMPAFANLLSSFSNPLLGIAAGAGFTAIIQSSSASVGILQALAVSGVIGLDSAVYVLFGQNIGTCITAVLASIGTSRNAKRATVIHLLFNIIGTVIFTVLCMATPLVPFVQSLVASPSAQIANMHTLFNIVTTLLLLPFGNQLVKVAMRLLPEQAPEKEQGLYLAYLTPLKVNQDRSISIGTSAIYLTQIRQELGRMLGKAGANIDRAFQSVLDGDTALIPEIEATEEYLDYLNKEILQYISKIISHENNEDDSATIGSYLRITGNVERIGDHALNIAEYTKLMAQGNLSFSEEARKEITEMQQVCLEVLHDLGSEALSSDKLLATVEQLEQRIDDMTASFRYNQLERLKTGACSGEACVLYSELLTDFERVGDHALNIAEEYSAVEGYA